MKILLLLLTGDALLVIAATYAGFLLRFGEVGEIHMMDPLQVAIVIVVVAISSYLFELYNYEKVLKIRELLLRTLSAIAVSFLALTSIFYLMPSVQFGRGVFALSLGAFCILQFLWHVSVLTMMNSRHLARKVLVLGTGTLAKIIGETIKSTNHQHVLEGYVNMTNEPIMVAAESVVGEGSGLARTLRERKPDKLIVSLSQRRGVLPLQDVLDCKFSGVEVIDAPTFYEELTGKLLIENITPSWFIFSNGFKTTHARRIFKRIFDVICSLAGFLFTLVLSPVIALAIKLDSRGPVLFRQSRVGEMEKEFDLYKFRTMCRDAEKATGAVWAKKDDSRVTRTGKFLRKTRLDELPQFYNVLRGDMSFIGPRPERPEFVQKLKQIIPYYPERHFVKPGLTGWAQIRYPYGASTEDAVEKLRFDLYYIKNISFFLDMLIILETVKVVLFGRGAR